MNIKNITVLVSASRHPFSGQPCHSRNDSVALTLAQALTSKLKVLHVGDPDNPALHDYLALGAEHIEVIPNVAEVDIVDNLADAVFDADLVLTGTRAEGGEDSGLLPYLLAASLDRPIIANVLEIHKTTHGIEVLQFLPKGKRRRLAVNSPAIIAVHPLAPVELSYAYARRQQGSISQRSPMPVVESQARPWQRQPARLTTTKLKAKDKKTGHARLLSAIVSESKGGLVVNEGNSVEKAQVILTYLREHHLINF
ncbi:hypothetical protein [Methylophaga sp. OBS4]|uniref:hypothetical protein n=1 Tax=Methylophaga sp. OBS4 TaxID=2991935 RepID=UPI0022510AD6|nr:hypothetical protein [Methylophaga sp. OBS4]MCX4187739.1 hypothetical protein [Methylophaga sp. OBS4]MCX4187742.1 hypothetical protein [Methylophaga sp. OBS4]